MFSSWPCDAYSAKMPPLTSSITPHILLTALSKVFSPYINPAHVTSWEFEHVRNCYFSKLVKAHCTWYCALVKLTCTEPQCVVTDWKVVRAERLVAQTCDAAVMTHDPPAHSQEMVNVKAVRTIFRIHSLVTWLLPDLTSPHFTPRPLLHSPFAQTSFAGSKPIPALIGFYSLPCEEK